MIGPVAGALFVLDEAGVTLVVRAVAARVARG
jgi:hypothetical protein